MKYVKTFEEFVNESTNRWYDKLLKLHKIDVSIKWVDDLTHHPDGLQDFIVKHFPRVKQSNLAVIFRNEVGRNWDKAVQIIGGVRGTDKRAGDFILVNAETA